LAVYVNVLVKAQLKQSFSDEFFPDPGFLFIVQ